MGTDIHLYVEYKLSSGEYVSLTEDEFKLPRDYRIFGTLAGVRTQETPAVLPRGFPDDASRKAYQSYFHRITDEDDDTRDEFGRYWLTEQPVHAQSCVERGLSRTTSWRGIDLVSDPEAHHASWLTAAEYRQALAAVLGDTVPEYPVVAAMLHLLERDHGRVVFWFDN